MPEAKVSQNATAQLASLHSVETADQHTATIVQSVQSPSYARGVKPGLRTPMALLPSYSSPVGLVP